MVYSPESDIPASPGDLLELFDAWQPWVVETGTPAETNKQAPLGLAMAPSSGDVLSGDFVPIAPEPVTYRRVCRDLDEVHLWVPRAASVLALGSTFSLSYREPYYPAKNCQDTPGDLVPATCLLAIPVPVDLKHIDLRAFRLTKTISTRTGRPTVNGTRQDRIETQVRGEREYVVIPETGMYPRISKAECDVLGQLVFTCMTFLPPHREGAPDEKER